MVNDFDYWSKEQYFPICQNCKQRYNTNTRWCSKECWIKQRNKKTFEEYVDEKIFGNVYHDKQCYFSNNDPLIEYWKILSLVPPKTKDEIKKQYYKLSLKYHPDKGGNNDKFIELKDAYDKLIL